MPVDHLATDRFLLALRAKRRADRITVKRLAEELSIHRTTLSDYELGRHTPQEPIVRRWAAFLGVDIPGDTRWYSRSNRQCGTCTGVNYHRIHGEKPDEPCAAWERGYQRAYKARRGQRMQPERRQECGGSAAVGRHREAGEELDATCAAWVLGHSQGLAARPRRSCADEAE